MRFADEEPDVFELDLRAGLCPRCGTPSHIGLECPSVTYDSESNLGIRERKALRDRKIS